MPSFVVSSKPNDTTRVWEEYDPSKGNVLQGSYATEGILALCEAIEAGTGSLTGLDVTFNGIELGDEGEDAIRRAANRDGLDLKLY